MIHLLTRCSLLPLLILASPAMAVQPPVTPMTPDVVATYEQVLPGADFIKRVEMIPMRDGTKLYTVLVMKKETTGGPILLSRTPYDAKGSMQRISSQRGVDILPAMDAEFFSDGYIIVEQDIRGMHHSEGQWVLTRPIVGPLNLTGIDESTDAYDTIDWLVKHVPEGNGKVGIIGSSYLGFTTLMAEINPHPALKAAVPESPMVDTWRGDDDFHNGAFRNPTVDYVVSMSTGKGDAGGIAAGPADDYTRYLAAGSTADLARHNQVEGFPFVQKLFQNPAYTDFWKGAGVDRARLAQALPQLPDTADELNAVAKDLGVSSADIHLGEDASETTVKRARLADYSIIYFATHGLLPGELHCQAEPGLVLSPPANTATTSDTDGLLESGEHCSMTSPATHPAHPALRSRPCRSRQSDRQPIDHRRPDLHRLQ